jgi:hypothetical protein
MRPQRFADADPRAHGRCTAAARQHARVYGELVRGNSNSSPTRRSTPLPRAAGRGTRVRRRCVPLQAAAGIPAMRELADRVRAPGARRGVGKARRWWRRRSRRWRLVARRAITSVALVVALLASRNSADVACGPADGAGDPALSRGEPVRGSRVLRWNRRPLSVSMSERTLSPLVDRDRAAMVDAHSPVARFPASDSVLARRVVRRAGWSRGRSSATRDGDPAPPCSTARRIGSRGGHRAGSRSIRCPDSIDRVATVATAAGLRRGVTLPRMLTRGPRRCRDAPGRAAPRRAGRFSAPSPSTPRRCLLSSASRSVGWLEDVATRAMPTRPRAVAKRAPGRGTAAAHRVARPALSGP